MRKSIGTLGTALAIVAFVATSTAPASAQLPTTNDPRMGLSPGLDQPSVAAAVFDGVNIDRPGRPTIGLGNQGGGKDDVAGFNGHLSCDSTAEPDVDGNGLGDETQDPDGGGLGDWEDDWFDDFEEGDELDENIALVPEPARIPNLLCGIGIPSYSIAENSDTMLTDYYEPGTVSPFVQGELDRHGSGLSLAASGKTIELTDFVIDPGASVLTGTVSVGGDVAADDAPLFFLDGRTLNPLQVNDNGSAVLEGTTVKLKAEAADLLNQTFRINDLQDGITIGIAKITINTSA